MEPTLQSLGSIWSGLVAILTALTSHDWMLVIFTGLLALFTWRVWRDTRILQRAYIAVEPRGIHLKLNGSDVIGHIGMRNAGHLPARDVSWFINVKHSLSGDEPETFFPLDDGKGSIVIAPAAVSTRGSRLSISLQALLTDCGANASGEKAVETDLWLYVWGSVRYNDGFNRMRATDFCHRYPWKMRGNGTSGPLGHYEIASEFARDHEHGNDAD